MLLIRADGNKEIGLGHVMRCLSIADACSGPVRFLTASGDAGELLAGRGYEYTVLGTDYSSMEQELPVLSQMCRDNPVILVDSYQATPSYMEALAGMGKTVYMDDSGAPVFRADVMVNYNLYAPSYRENYEGKCSQALLGCSYAPLRREFQNTRYTVKDTVRDVLITTGGSSRYPVAARLLSLLLEERKGTFPENVRYHVVCGMFSDSGGALGELAQRRPEIRLYRNVTRMWELMEQCDVAVSAAGSTMYELCAAGVPSVCFSFADNQILPGEAFGSRTPAVYAGNYENDPERTLDQIAGALQGFLPVKARAAASAGMRRLVDGHGPERIAAALGCGKGGPSWNRERQ